MIHNTQYVAGGNIETVTGSCAQLVELAYTGVDDEGALVTYDISENIPNTFSPVKGTIIFARNSVGINNLYPDDSGTTIHNYAGVLICTAEKDGFNISGW